MIKVKTFVTPLKVYHTHEELEKLDADVNNFLEENGIEDFISVSDAVTTDDSGATIGLVRVIAFSQP
jgi:hypothetical protein